MRRALLLAFAKLAGAATLAGCLRQDVEAPRDLLTARAAVAQARASPLSPLAAEELAEAERALLAAEREAQRRPRSESARDAAYVAQRKAQCSQLASLAAASREALASARAAEQLRIERLHAADPPRDNAGPATPQTGAESPTGGRDARRPEHTTAQ